MLLLRREFKDKLSGMLRTTGNGGGGTERGERKDKKENQKKEKAVIREPGAEGGDQHRKSRKSRIPGNNLSIKSKENRAKKSR